ncbi:MAG: helix-turn-helix domain-containing protein [Rhodospirillaceae bacterium]
MSRIAILYEQWFTHAEVGADEIAVLAALALHADRAGRCFPTQGLIASVLNRSRPWVNKIIGRLVELGLVGRTHRTRDDGGDRSCLYHLIQPSPIGSRENTRSHPDDSVKTDQEINQETLPAATPDVFMPSSDEPVSPDQDWQPADNDLCWAMTRFPDADLQALSERFVARCRAKGYRYRDLGAAWRSWLLDDVGKTGTAVPNRTDKRPPPASYGRYEAWARAASHGGGRHAA